MEQPSPCTRIIDSEARPRLRVRPLVGTHSTHPRIAKTRGTAHERKLALSGCAVMCRHSCRNQSKHLPVSSGFAFLAGECNQVGIVGGTWLKVSGTVAHSPEWAIFG